MKYRNRTNHVRHGNMHMETAVNQTDHETDVAEETTAMKTETIDGERMSRECRDSQNETSYDAASKLTPCVSVPQPQEEQMEYPIQIKHEPELILEPEELPDSAITDVEAITNDDGSSVDLRNKIDHNKCYICDKVFETSKDVRLHLSDHVNMIPYECSACTIKTGQELKITSLYRLHIHFRMHVSAFKCPKCPHQTRTEYGMQTHIRTNHGHSDQVEYICKQCGKNCLNKRSLYKHVRGHQALDEARYRCSFCDMKFPTNVALIQHERIHTGERPYQCHECTKSFRLSWCLNEHISKVHKKSEQVNDGPIRTCKFEGCDFSTTNKRKFFRHKARHELKLQCTQCSQRFSSGHQLRRHQYVHTGVKRFQCEQCDKSFQSKQSFEEHVAGHNNERPYDCEICGLPFVLKRHLKKHLLNHSAQLSFECRHCGIKFSNSISHAQHEKTHMKTAVKLTEPKTDEAEETPSIKTEIIDAERIPREFRDSQGETSYEAASKLTPCDSIPQLQEEQIELPVQIKREPELILEPEELPDFAVIDAQTVMDSAESSAREFSQMHNIALDRNKSHILRFH